MSSSAAPPQLCPADRSADAHLPCAASAMPTTSCRSTAVREMPQNRPGELILSVVAQGSEQSGCYPSPVFFFSRAERRTQVEEGRSRRGARLGALSAAHPRPRASLERFTRECVTIVTLCYRMCNKQVTTLTNRYSEGKDSFGYTAGELKNSFQTPPKAYFRRQ